MNWKPSFAIVLLGVTTITYLGGVILDNQDIKKKKTLCCCFALLGLLPLLIFKYYNFLNDSLTSLLESVGLQYVLPGLNWAIPIGISFFTFQATGYMLDVYHGRIPAEKNFLDYALFISFFPQVTSGPISTAKDLMPQFKHPHVFNYEQGRDGLKLILWGLLLKCVIADRLGLYVDVVFANFEHFSGINCFVASIYYTMQIYGDFAGYSLMAIGIAKTIGFNLINNFNRPYFATSITEFWKRWHISLTRWLTTHVYINLGGNRCSKARQYLNIMVTFLVSGLWHGANWNFIAWGFIHGLLQVFEKAIGLGPNGKYYARINSIKWLSPIRLCITFLCVNFAWIFFRSPDITTAFNIICRIITDRGHLNFSTLGVGPLIMLSIVLPIVLLKEFKEEYTITLSPYFTCRIAKWVLYILLAAIILNFGVMDGGQFIYINF